MSSNTFTLNSQTLSTQVGVPQDFVIPEQYRRDLGPHPQDVRGSGYFLAIGAFSSSIISIATVFVVMFIGAGLSLVPAVLGVTLGILGLNKTQSHDPEKFRKATRNYSIWAIVIGVIGIALSILSIFLFFWIQNTFQESDIFITS